MRWAEPAPVGRRAPRTLDRWLFGAALAASALVLFWPSAPGPPLFPYADKLVHAVLFLAVAWSGLRSTGSVRMVGVGLVAYAVGSEVLQHVLLAGRSGSWTDVVADLVGAAIGLGLARPRSGRGRTR